MLRFLNIFLWGFYYSSFWEGVGVGFGMGVFCSHEFCYSSWNEGTSLGVCTTVVEMRVMRRTMSSLT